MTIMVAVVRGKGSKEGRKVKHKERSKEKEESLPHTDFNSGILNISLTEAHS